MEIVQITVVAVLSAVLALVLKKDTPQFALLVGIAASALLLLAVLPRLSEVLGLMSRLSAYVDGGAHYVTLLKVIGIAYATEFGAQICVDAGETAVASKLELAGKLLIMTVAAPLVLNLAEQVLSLVP